MIDKKTYQRIYSSGYQDGRREGAKEARKQADAVIEGFAHRLMQTGAEEMRELAAHTARLILGSGSGTGEYIARAIEALPLHASHHLVVANAQHQGEDNDAYDKTADDGNNDV